MQMPPWLAAEQGSLGLDHDPAHLTGALGVPTWTLLPTDCDWRWINDQDSPWYPAMRLFRQRRAHEWQPVVAAVQENLVRIVADRRELQQQNCLVRL